MIKFLGLPSLLSLPPESLDQWKLRRTNLQANPWFERRSLPAVRGGASTALVGVNRPRLQRVTECMPGLSERRSSEAPSYLHFYTNVSPDAPLLGQVLWGESQNPVTLHEANGATRDVSYVQLALSTPSTPASGGRTPRRTPTSTPHSPFLHPHTAAVPSPSSPATSGILPRSLPSHRNGAVSPRTSSQNDLSVTSQSAQPSIPFYSNLTRSLSTIVSKTSTQTTTDSHQSLRRLGPGPHGLSTAGSTFTMPSNWFSYTESRSTTLPSSASTCSIPAKPSSKTQHVVLIQSSFSSARYATPVPSEASKAFSEESMISLPSSTSQEVPYTSSSNSEADGAVPMLATLPHRSKSKFFPCERVYINTLQRVSGSLPESFFRSLQGDYTEPFFPASSAYSPKSPKSPKTGSSKRRKGEHEADEIEMM